MSGRGAGEYKKPQVSEVGTSSLLLGTVQEQIRGNTLTTLAVKQVKVRDAKGVGKEEKKLETHHPVKCLAALPDGRLASGSGDSLGKDNAIRLWNLSSGSCEQILEGRGGGIHVLVVLPDGRLASGSGDISDKNNEIRLWNLNSIRCEQVLEGHTSRVTALVILHDGRLASGARDGTIRIWNLNNGQCEQILEKMGGAEVYALAVLPDGKLASGSSDITGKEDGIKLWNLKSGRCERILEKTRHNRITQIALLPDIWQDRWLVCLSPYGYSPIQLWNLSSGQCERFIEEPSDKIFDHFVTLPGHLATSESFNKKTIIKLWSLNSWQCEQVLEGHNNSVVLTVLPDGRLASGSYDKTIRVWKVAPTLRALSLEEVFSLLALLKRNYSVSQLSLEEVPLDDGHIPSLIDLALTNTALTHLNLRQTKITPNGYRKLYDAIKARKPILQIKDLEENSELQFSLGVSFQEGDGVEKDMAQAFILYQKAALQGHVLAQNNLANCYRSGWGTPKDEYTALTWYRRAADQGAPEAIASIGICYEYGLGVEKDISQARSWYQKAAAKENTYAINRLKEPADTTPKTQPKKLLESAPGLRELKEDSKSQSIQEKFEQKLLQQQQEFEQRLEAMLESARKQYVEAGVRTERELAEMVLQQLSTQEPLLMQLMSSQSVESQLRDLKATEAQVQKEIATLRAQVSENPLLRNRLLALEQQVQPLLEEYEERQQMLQAQQYILQNLSLKTFYNRVQVKLNQIFLAYMAIGSGQIAYSDKTNQAISLLGKPLGVMTLGFGTLLTEGINFLRNRKQKKKMVQVSDNFVISIVQTEALVERVARFLALRYEEQIKETTVPGAESLLSKVTFSSGPNGGAETLAECAVARIMDALRSGSIVSHEALDEQLVNSVFLSIHKQGFIPHVMNQSIKTTHNKTWTDQGIFRNSGIKLPGSAPEWYAGREVCHQVELYGYRWGALEEVRTLGLVKQRPPAKVAATYSPALNKQVMNVAEDAKAVKAKQEYQEELLRRERERNQRLELEVQEQKKRQTFEREQLRREQEDMREQMRLMQEQMKQLTQQHSLFQAASPRATLGAGAPTDHRELSRAEAQPVSRAHVAREVGDKAPTGTAAFFSPASAVPGAKVSQPAAPTNRPTAPKREQPKQAVSVGVAVKPAVSSQQPAGPGAGNNHNAGASQSRVQALVGKFSGGKV